MIEMAGYERVSFNCNGRFTKISKCCIFSSQPLSALKLQCNLEHISPAFCEGKTPQNSVAKNSLVFLTVLCAVCVLLLPVLPGLVMRLQSLRSSAGVQTSKVMSLFCQVTWCWPLAGVPALLPGSLIRW